MKKIAFTVIILAGFSQVKAQQRFALPNILTPNQNFTIKPDTGNWKKYLDKYKSDQLLKNRFANTNTLAAFNQDHMPIVRPRNNSRMPIVQTDKTGYTMPVAGINLPGVYEMKKTGDGEQKQTP